MRRQIHGFSLFELLVAVLVASIGLLGWVSLQAMSQRYAQLNQRRALADLLAQDFVERMRINTVVASNLGYYELTDSFATQLAQAPDTLAAPSCDAASSVCSVEDLARSDLKEVRTRIRNLLPPDGALYSERLPSSADASRRTVDVWVAWREPAWRDSTWALRDASECPEGLKVADDLTVRCLRWRVRR